MSFTEILTLSTSKSFGKIKMRNQQSSLIRKVNQSNPNLKGHTMLSKVINSFRQKDTLKNRNKNTSQNDTSSPQMSSALRLKSPFFTKIASKDSRNHRRHHKNLHLKKSQVGSIEKTKLRKDSNFFKKDTTKRSPTSLLKSSNRTLNRSIKNLNISKKTRSKLFTSDNYTIEDINNQDFEINNQIIDPTLHQSESSSTITELNFLKIRFSYLQSVTHKLIKVMERNDLHEEVTLPFINNLIGVQYFEGGARLNHRFENKVQT